MPDKPTPHCSSATLTRNARRCYCCASTLRACCTARAGRLKKVFWVQVEPSAWRGSELASFQSWEFNLNEALTAIVDGNAKLRTVVKICEDIAFEMDTVSEQLGSDLVFVRDILGDHALERGLVVDSSLSDGKGAVATVCRGRKGSEDVAIKVLRGSQITKLSAAFNDMVHARMSLTNHIHRRRLRRRRDGIRGIGPVDSRQVMQRDARAPAVGGGPDQQRHQPNPHRQAQHRMRTHHSEIDQDDKPHNRQPIADDREGPGITWTSHEDQAAD